ncbi:type IV toxin-antitoxin system AbiEi family antitoxin domain-containing protein [Blastococcus capsensis]|uniref:type IV toxin-antitoxin system AbiEi family antitoxin domain-containing protein n=1 Tax=Blastococcus capsensis TaxID=1564163 RepID=UPI002540BD2F|nr:type IV toxin-antitoxin system AbiEi family antitoxin domain-containing protein [Blastococcus capsensis]MDK3256052.1 type IV toxin-antitoxin system AbiEi family antitoxin domain-containing protein [Blastococcus capsensis]
MSERRLGIFTTADALGAGYGASEIRALCRSGSWVRLRRGVLIDAAALAAAEATGRRYDVDCLAVLLSLDRPSALLSHASAARLWELPTPRTAEPVLRLTDPVQWRRGRDYLMTCAPLSAGERWWTGPLPLTSAARTLVDCAREWPLEDAVVAMDAALLAERVTPDDLRRATAAVHHWRGAGRAARATAHADGRAESPLETRGRLRIVGAGLPAPELQVEVRAGGRLVGVVDA